MNLLDAILLHKSQEIQAREKQSPGDRLKEMPLFGRQSLSLRDSLAGKRLGVIAELKKASPSRGVIREQFDPGSIARGYVQAGASALSVLTDARFFQGSLTTLSDLRGIVNVPLLRKDFIIDSYQLVEAKAYGADAVLLIAAALPPERLHELYDEAVSLGLECLVEVHTEAEIASLDGVGCSLIGINNRDLATFTTDLSVSLRLRPLIKGDVAVVSESGIACAEDLRRLIAADIHAVLIGEAFMKHKRPGDALAQLLNEAGDTN